MAVLTAAQVARCNGMCSIAVELQLGTRLQYLDSDGSYNGPIEVDATTAHALLQNGIAIGANANTTGSGVALTITSPMTRVISAYGEDNGAVYTPSGSVTDIRTGVFCHLLTTAHAAANIRAFGLQGVVAGYNATWNGEVVAGVEGIAQVVTTSSKTYGGYGVTAGVAARLATGASTVVINTNHIFAGVVAISDMKGTVTQTGKSVAFLTKIYDTTNWSDATSRAA